MEKESEFTHTPEKKRSLLQSIIVGSAGILAAVYVLNPGAGIIELIPDNIPIIGNLDEAAAVALLISCLSYFGVELGSLFGRKSEASETRQAKGKVVDE